MNFLDAIIAVSRFSEFWPIDSRAPSLIKLGGKFLVEHLLDHLTNFPIKQVYLIADKEDKQYVERINFDKYAFRVNVTYIDGSRDVTNIIVHANADVTSNEILFLFGHDFFAIEYLSSILANKCAYIMSDREEIIRAFHIPRSLFNRLAESENLKGELTKICTKISTEFLFPIFPWHLFQIMKLLMKKMITKKFIHPSARVSKWAIIEGPVYIDEGAKLYRNAIISGPAYIGKDAIIGDHTLVRDSIIEQGALVGCFMEVARSILQENVETHSGYLGDSIIDKFSHLGAGFISANLRLDRGYIYVTVGDEKINTGMTKLGAIIGERTEVGVHVATMPGKLIGKNVVIGPGTVIFKNIDDNTIIYAEFKYIEKQR